MFNHKLGRIVVALLLFALMFAACAPEDQDEYLEQQTQRIQEPAADTTARTAPEPTTTSAKAYIQEQIEHTALHPNSEGYALASQKIKELVLKYAYNPDRAKEIVAEEMVLMGAELIDGIWHYDGTPVEIIIISRGNDEREDIGNYFAEQLKTIGFKAVTN